MAAEAEAALAWLRRQRDDPRQSTEVRVRSAEAGMLEVRCGKDVRLQLSAPHRDKLHELYCRTLARRVGKEEPAFLRALFCLLLRYDSVGGAGHQAALNRGAFEVLLRRFGCDFECFASPLNCRYER